MAITYTVDGKVYNNTFFNMGGTYNVGEDMKVYYNPDDPNSITNSKTGFVPYIMIIVGAALLVFGIFKTVTAFKKSGKLDKAVPKAQNVDFNGYKTTAGVTEYYCLFDGKSLKPGYKIEDSNKNIIFEGKMTKQALVGARTFEFYNHLTGSKQEHAVGHTVTQNYNDEFFSATSWFKFDDENIWDVLHQKGIRIITDIKSKFPNLIYNISKDGRPFAIIETSGKYVHEEDAAQHKINIPVGRYYYRIWTNSSDTDNLFLTIFAISETEQTIVE